MCNIFQTLSVYVCASVHVCVGVDVQNWADEKTATREQQHDTLSRLSG